MKQKCNSPAASSRFQGKNKSVKIENHIKEKENKLISIEQCIKSQNQSATEEIIQKLEQSMKYDEQLFGIMKDNMLSGALLAPVVRLNIFSQESLRPVASDTDHSLH